MRAGERCIRSAQAGCRESIRRSIQGMLTATNNKVIDNGPAADQIQRGSAATPNK
jgi:hypothetical protein